MVWIVAHTTVRASTVGFNFGRPTFPAPATPIKRQA